MTHVNGQVTERVVRVLYKSSILIQNLRKYMLTLASATNLSNVSLAHFKFIDALGKASQEILMNPFFHSSLRPTPASIGGLGVHLGPAKSLIL